MNSFSYSFKINAFVTLGWLISASSLPAAIFHVKPGADPANAANGQSWGTATNLQRALALAVAGDEIYVASGRYYPDEGAGQTDGNRTASFTLKVGVSVYGGFAGTESLAAQRVFPPAAPSVLSGDISQDDKDPDGDGITAAAADITGGNSYHIVKIPRNFVSALDGFTITGGQANGSAFADKEAAAMMIDTASPVITRCTIIGHQGFNAITADNRTPVFEDCMFANTSGNAIDAARVGGMKIVRCQFSGHTSSALRLSLSSGTIADCVFTGNSAQDGGGIHNSNSSPAIERCRFSGNKATRRGGGIYNSGGSSPAVANCLFSGNVAEDGGGMYNDRDDSGFDPIFSAPRLTNCTFAGNFAEDDGGGLVGNGSSAITNCVFWRNTAYFGENDPESNIRHFSAGNPVFTNCLIGNSGGSGAGWQSDLGVDGGGNVDADPRFAAPIAPASTPSTAGDFRLTSGSPALNAGAAADSLGATDLAGNPRVIGTAVDMGAYEFGAAPVAVAAALTMEIRMIAGQRYPTLIYEAAAALEATHIFTIERSPTGSSWAAAADIVQLSRETNGGVLRVAQRTAQPLPTPASNFFRLRIAPK